jgi:hypothetical protein
MVGNTLMHTSGRKVGNAEYENTDGQPILYIHGTPSSRIHRYKEGNSFRSPSFSKSWGRYQ